MDANFFVHHFRARSHAFDPIDRLSYHYTSLILIVAGFVHLGKNVGLVGDAAIQCWVPAQFTDSWESYAENYCYAQSTYFVPMTEHSDAPSAKMPRKILYYQWVSLCLLLQGLLFYAPMWIWKALKEKSGEK